jgi:hypothetical protein
MEDAVPSTNPIFEATNRLRTELDDVLADLKGLVREGSPKRSCGHHGAKGTILNTWSEATR